MGKKKSIIKPVFGSKTQLTKKYSIARVVDQYDSLLEELFLIRNPKFRFNKYSQPLAIFKKNLSDELKNGKWVYFKWNKTLVHFLPDEIHQEIRTARNKMLITSEEQSLLYNSKIGIAGLSVGSHAALTLSIMGIGRSMTIADGDVVSGSNLNRIRFDFTKIGQNKCQMVTEQIYQMNPYASVEQFPAGIGENEIDSFFITKEPMTLFIEEVDNLAMKILLRLKARSLGIPVVMATDNGDGIIVDIERFDKEPARPIFHGVLGNISANDIKRISPNDIPRMASLIAGVDLITPRMLTSLQEVGKTLYSWPQLGDAATLTGVAIAYLAKRIILGDSIKSGKYEINLDAIFDDNYFKKSNINARNFERSKYKHSLKIP